MRSLLARGGTRLAASCTGLALIAAAPVALGAESAPLRSQADRLRDQASSLGTERQHALLNLYALEHDLDAAHAAVAGVEARRAAVAREHASARHRLAIVERAAGVSHGRLEELLRRLYADGGADPLAIVLGSRSLDEALAGLESLDRAAAENRRILEQARAARAELLRVDARLTARERELDRLAAAVRERAGELEAAAEAKAAYVETLRHQEDLTMRQVSSLETQAEAAQELTAQLDRQPAATPAAPITSGTLRVSAIGYSLRGRTASGLPAGPGIVAVDPSVIPLGTRLYVPGYGDAVAADTGGAIRGHVIDLWFPTTAAARAWGRREVVITLR